MEFATYIATHIATCVATEWLASRISWLGKRYDDGFLHQNILNLVKEWQQQKPMYVWYFLNT